MKKSLVFVELVALFVKEFFLANIHVMRCLFRSNKKLCPAIVRVPLDIKESKGLWIFASIISLTPGSLIVETSKKHNLFYVHLLHEPHPDAWISFIKDTFERRIAFIFEGREVL